ncbi:MULTISPECIES: hypothetical protein [unclassified Aliiroseovarius]|nr:MULTISPECIES: hypothetical protein [unclassified Aliiroseovarius]
MYIGNPEDLFLRKLSEQQRRFQRKKAEFGNLRTRKSKRGAQPSRKCWVTAWDGWQEERVVCLEGGQAAPSTICFDRNVDQTFAFVDRWYNAHGVPVNRAPSQVYDWYIYGRNGKLLKPKTIRNYTDFSTINELSTAAALVMTADYDNARKIMGKVPPTIDLHDWNDGVFRKLWEIGFFETVGLTDAIEDRYEDDGDTRTMKIVCGQSSLELQEACEAIADLSKFVEDGGALKGEVQIGLNSAIAEAMANVAKHAYPTDHTFEFEHSSSWWVTASVRRSDRTLTVVFYDRGATIPITLPQKHWWEELKHAFKGNIGIQQHDFEYDAEYIEMALRVGKTQTKVPWRGKGLPQMKELIDMVGSGSLTIISRGGLCRYSADEGVQKSNHPHSIGGTLIEWSLKLPSESLNE